MKTYTIPQKMSGTGTIHDIASQHYDREIRFRKGCEYAISFAIIDADGNRYASNYDELVKLD